MTGSVRTLRCHVVQCCLRRRVALLWWSESLLHVIPGRQSTILLLSQLCWIV